MILLGDCLDKLKELEDNSVDAVVTDPPYGLKFMGKKWDYDVPQVSIWREVLRVLKPGGHLLSFAGTRTYHRVATNIEESGFEIRDQLQWLYGSGFPKSLDISKAIDKAAGAEREVVGQKWAVAEEPDGKRTAENTLLTAPATDDAKQWQGWGTALKPANEPIVLARKPLSESTVAKNVLRWGVGGLNIDESRIASPDANANAIQRSAKAGLSGLWGQDNHEQPTYNPQGRWPANLLLGCDCENETHDPDCAVAMLDEQSGDSPSNKRKSKAPKAETLLSQNIFKGSGNPGGANDSGGASRFFYVAKASKRERNAGLEGMPLVNCGMMEDDNYEIKTGSGNLRDTKRQNFHPTVKPIKLMEYLIKLVTPPNGTVLDPFAGSGSTGVAAKKNGFKFIGCEMSAEYVEIAEKRIANASA